MSIGYACLTIGVEDTSIKSCIMRNATDTRLKELIAWNLNSLNNILDYNIANNIRLFRISSDLIPFGSSPVNRVPWWEIFEQEFQRLGDKIRAHDIRVSMHPGQYTVLNSLNEDVVKRAIEDLRYHAKVLSCLKVGYECKIILHVGGVYGDKEQALNRFIFNYQGLEQELKHRIVIENDDKCYNIQEVLMLGLSQDIPVVYDNLHHIANPTIDFMSHKHWIDQCKQTWKKKDGIQKMHYSQQDKDKKLGSHSNSINLDEFIAFFHELNREDIDIMLEVKDKNLSALNCILYLKDSKPCE
ncbi:MAG: damage repair endonuclease UvdE [Herbinix sp.]|jgi:UV DNA damage endonuclease|nr:damage repair endonuclease UvdE [Herbinix sp.]